MVLHESTSMTGRIIAFTDNGMLSIKQNSEICLSRLTKHQAIDLGKTILGWANNQPDPPAEEPTRKVM